MKKSTIASKTEQNETMRKREISSRHIKDFRKNDIKLTQSELSERLGFDFQAVGRYERMECSVSDRAANAFTRLSGYIKEYWLGETECKTEEEYDIWCYNAAEDDYYQEIKRIERKNERIANLLSLCGFGYDNLSDGKYDFVEITGTSELKNEISLALENHTPHKVSDQSKQLFTNPVYLTDDELDTLVVEIRNTVGFFCYKKIVK